MFTFSFTLWRGARKELIFVRNGDGKGEVRVKEKWEVKPSPVSVCRSVCLAGLLWYFKACRLHLASCCIIVCYPRKVKEWRLKNEKRRTRARARKNGKKGRKQGRKWKEVHDFDTEDVGKRIYTPRKLVYWGVEKLYSQNFTPLTLLSTFYTYLCSAFTS